MDFKKDVTKALQKAGIKEIRLETPPNPAMGDVAFACFRLSDNPANKAKEISLKIKPIGLIERVESVGPYVNFYVNNKKFVQLVLKEAKKKTFGKGLKKKEKAVIEHTSINPNASPHVGRARNALIGDSIARTLNFYGYKVETHYWVNDIGKQIAMLAYIMQRDNIKKFDFEEMLNLYVKVNAEMITNATVEKEVFNLLQKLEAGDKKTIAVFEKVSRMAFKGQQEILSKLGIKFNKVDFESELLKSKKTLNFILKKLKKKTRKAKDGRLVLDLSGYDLPMKEPILPLTRANGTSLYALRDIGYHVYKMKLAKKNIVVLGEDHKLENMQIKIILEKMLKIASPEVVHYSFILLQGEKMSTRKGTVVLLTEFMREAKEKAKQELKKRNSEITFEKLEKLSETIGYAALKYSILKVSPEKNVLFSWDEALNFEGESAPYIQYTHVRAKKILKKIKEKKPKNIVLEDEPEVALVKKISEFPDVVKEVAESYRVHLLAKYSFELATKFNEFYERCSVMNENDTDKKYSRLLLVKVYYNLIEKCLDLLGINSPEFM